MKKILILTGSAVLGSVLTLFFLHLIGSPILDFSDSYGKSTNTDFIQHTSYSGSASGIAGADFVEASEKVMPTVVHISTKTTVRTSAYPPGMEMWQDFFGPQWQFPQQQQENVQQGSGSGVIVQKDGYIVTNNHVIKGADEITVTLHDKRSFTAKVIGSDPNTDIALIKIEADTLDVVQFANSDAVKIGEWVLAVGNPFNLNSTVTAGIVSAKGRNINILKQKYAIESFIQTDAAINPGNSGGALVNANGDLIGINTAIASPTGSYSGYGFAVPSNIVSKVIFDLKKYGVVQRGFIGVSIRELDSKLAEEKGLKVSDGVYVDALVEDGAGEKAGMKEGDIILEIDGIKVTSPSEIQEVIGRRSPGDAVSVKINRKGDEKTLDLVLTNNDGEEKISEKGAIDIIANLGITVENADAKILKKIGKASGVQVTNIESGAVQKHTSMQKGFVITKVDNQIIKDVKQFSEIMKNKNGGGVMIEGVYPDRPGTFYYAFGL